MLSNINKNGREACHLCVSPNTKRAVWPEDSLSEQSDAYVSCISPKWLRRLDRGAIFRIYYSPWKDLEEFCIKI